MRFRLVPNSGERRAPRLHPTRRPRARGIAARAGLTLAEVTISTLLVGMVVVASLRTVGSSLQTWQASAGQMNGYALARPLMAEILSVPYEDPDGSPSFGSEAGEPSPATNRSAFDDSDDFDNLADSPPKDSAGAALSGYTGWSRTVNVVKLVPASYQTLADNAADEGLRQITVTVTDPQARTTTLVAYRSNKGGMQQSQGVDETLVTWVGCRLQIGSGTAVSSGTFLTNHAEDRTP